MALDQITAPLARASAAFIDAEGWVRFGHARLEDHVRERYGRSGRWLRDLAALGHVFCELPALDRAVSGADGGAPLGRVAGLLVGRIATPETLGAWIERARSLSVRELREEIAAAREGGGKPERGSIGGEGDLFAHAGGSSGCTASVETERNAPASLLPVLGRIGDGPAPQVADDDDDEAARSLVRLMVPAPVSAAFDEALDLFRAIEGREASVTSFIEALVAEAASSAALPAPHDGACREVLRRGELAALRERALARSTGRWDHLPAAGLPDWSLHLAEASLEKLRRVSAESGKGGPVALDFQIRTLVELEDEIETRLATLMARMADEGAWERLRFDSAVHYAEQRLGLGRSAARLRLRVVRVLRRLSRVKEAYEKGAIGSEAAWLVSRMIGRSSLDPRIQEVWIERARLSTVKRLRDELRLAARRAAGLSEGPGGDPAAGGTTSAAPCPTPAPDRDGAGPVGAREPDIAQSEAAAASIPGPAPITPPLLPVSDAEWHASLRREVGTARKRIACLGEIAASHAVSDVFLRLRLPAELAVDFLAAIEAARVRCEVRAGEIPWEEPWPEPDPPGSLRAAREFFVHCRRTPAWVGLLALLEDFVVTWDVDHARSRKKGQKIYARYGWRCAAPGCTSRRNLEDHHIHYRGRGGDNDHSNRLCLCRFHHQLGEHGDLARVRGRAPLAVLWRLGRAGCGGKFRNELRLPPTRA